MATAEENFYVELEDLGYPKVKKLLRAEVWWGDKGKWAKRWLRRERRRRRSEQKATWRLGVALLGLVVVLVALYLRWGS